MTAVGRISRVCVAAVVVAALLGACGSDGGGDSDKPLSKSEYIRRADGICARYSGRINSIVKAAPDDQNVDEARSTLQNTLIPLFRAQLDELIQLRRPPADEETLQIGFLLNLQRGINAIVDRVSKATSIPELDAINPKELGDAKKAAKAYGMKRC